MFKQILKSPTLLLNEQSCLLEKKGTDVIKFGFGQSPFPAPDFVIDALRDAAEEKNYAPVQGILELRRAVSEFHKKTDKIDIDPENIFIAPGSKLLLYSVMTAFEKLDVLIPAPAWVSYAPQAELLGHNAIHIPTTYEDRWRISPEKLQTVLSNRKDKTKPSLLILTYPGNPDGLTYSADALQSFVEVLRQHEVFVLSDEIYGLLDFKGNHTSLARFYPERTIVTGGLSKWCALGGWRLGTALLPEELSSNLKPVMLGIASETYSCATIPVQIAACSAYNWDTPIENFVKTERKILSYVGNWVVSELREAGIRVHAPEGGFYIFLDFIPFKEKMAARGIFNSQDLCKRMLNEVGVALLAGEAFGMAGNDFTARLSYTHFDGKTAFDFVAGLSEGEEMSAVSQEQCFPLVKEGMDRIKNWLMN